MMLIEDVRPFPEEGQWWVHRYPLWLAQVKTPGEITLMREWHPLEGFRETETYSLEPEQWFYLGWQAKLDVDWFDQFNPVRLGDAYAIDQRAFMINEIVKDVVTITSTYPVMLTKGSFTRLFRGPPSPEPSTVFERLGHAPQL